jgi:hypothetical protein
MSYNANSPYYTTQIVNGQFLDIMSNRPIYGDANDVYWSITPTYHLRPDLLAYDLYKDSKLWWVFSQRNPNTLKDPLFDFISGTKIYIPKQDAINQSLGL